MLPPTLRIPRLASSLSQRAFTLIELLTVVAIIGVLAAIFFPVLGHVRAAAMSSECSSNLRQIGSAFQLYAADNHGLYPAPRKSTTSAVPTPLPGTNPLGSTWQPEIAPYILRSQNLGQIKSTGAAVNIAHCPAYDRLFPSLAAEAATNYNTAGYGMNMNVKNDAGVIFNNNNRFPAAAIGKPAATILVGDSGDYHLGINVAAGWQTIPADPMRPDGYNSGAPLRHGSSANYLFADGHVQSLSPTAAIAILKL